MTRSWCYALSHPVQRQRRTNAATPLLRHLSHKDAHSTRRSTYCMFMCREHSVSCRLGLMTLIGCRSVRLTTAAGILHTCLAALFAAVRSIPGFIRNIDRVTVGHRRRDVISLAHHGRQSVWQKRTSAAALALNVRVRTRK